MNPLDSSQPMLVLSSVSLGALHTHISAVDSTIKQLSQEILENNSLWNELVKREFPEASADISRADFEKYLHLLNKALFTHLVRIDPMNLKFCAADNLESDAEPVKMYENLNKWVLDTYSKKTLAQVLSLSPESIQPEHDNAVLKVLERSLRKTNAISVVHLSEFGRIASDRLQSDALTHLTDKQLELIISAIDTSETLANLSLINVELQDSQLEGICKLIARGKILSLDLSQNKISDEGAKILSASLAQQACEIVQLSLDGNNLTEVGAGAIISAVQDKDLIIVQMRANKIPPDLREELMQKGTSDDFTGPVIELE